MKSYEGKNGEVIIREMTDTHIVNALRLFRKHLRVKSDEAANAYAYGEPCGDMASYYFSQAASAIEDEVNELVEIIAALEKEKKRRQNPAAVSLGKIKSEKKAEAARANGKKGGRPKKLKTSPSSL